MKMSGRVTSCCVALFFALTSVSAVQKRCSINGLKNIDFGRSVPKHSLVLLYWFANTVYIDNNNVIWLTFDPNGGDYGSHPYYNDENLPLPLSRGYEYYTIGNLNEDTLVPFPDYVLNPPIPEYVETNRDRIIICVREQSTGWGGLRRIEQVYITQHYDRSERQGTRYDPAHTYRITNRLLRQIREFSEGLNQQQLQRLRNDYGSNADNVQLRQIRNTWGDLAGLGLLLLIVIQEKYSFNQPKRNGNGRNQHNNDSSRDSRDQHECVVEFHDNEDDHEAIGNTRNRESGSYNTVRSPCCICCIVFIGLTLLSAFGALLYYLMKR